MKKTLFIIFCLISTLLVGQKGVRNEGISFMENKGQLAYKNGRKAKDVFFQLSANGIELFLTNKGLTYYFIKPDDETNQEELVVNSKQKLKQKYFSWEKMDVHLLGANIIQENIVKEGESLAYDNFYYPHCPEGILGVKSYKRITIKDVYPNIDWVLYVNEKESSPIKYDFIVHPSGNPKDIKLHYKGSENLKIEFSPKQMVLKNSIGQLEDKEIVSFSKRKRINTNFIKISDNTFGFELIDEWDKSSDLIIDPALIWATYYGWQNDDEFYGVHSDGDSVYFVGVSNANFGGILNPGGGAYTQMGNGLASDGHIARFDTAGARQWSTHYGSSAVEAFWNVHSNGTDVCVVGWAGAADMPTFNPGGGAYFDNTLSGGKDAFIARFNSLGVREWATFFGGTAGEEFIDVEFDGTNWWVVGTGSSGFPTLALGGAYNDATVGGSSDGSILKFSPTGVLLWSTFYGGSGTSDGILDLNFDGTNMWIAANTNSADYPTLNPGGGAYFDGTFNGGTTDGAISKFSIGGARLWSTYIGGSDIDRLTSVFSNGTDVWLLGSTRSTNFPTLNPGGTAFYDGTKNTGAANYSMVVTRFNTAGVRQWGSYLEGSGGEALQCGISGDANNAIIAARTSSADFPIQAKAGAFNDNTYGGSNDAVMVQFNTSDELEWSTYLGSTDVDELKAVHYDGTNIWACGWSWSNFPTVDPGGTTYHKGIATSFSDAIIVKFASLGGPCGACALSGSGSLWTWTGCIDTDWFDPCNWDRQSVPTTTSDVLVPNTTNKPIITGAFGNCRTIEVQSSTGATLEVQTTLGGGLNVTF